MHEIRRFSIGVALLAFATLPASAQSVVSGAVQTGNAAPTVRVEGVASAGSAFWEVLNDSTLNRLMEQALRGSLDLRAAQARLDGAGASRLQAALELVPSVNASAGYTRRRQASASFPGGGGSLPSQGLWDSGLNASWELDVFGRLRGSLKARDALQESAGEDVRDARVAVAAEVTSSYFDLRGTQGQLAVAQRNADNQRRTLELTQNRLDAGRGTAFDTERAKAQLNITLAAIPLLEARIAALQYRIGVLVGRSPQELANELAAAGSLPDLPDVPPLDSPVEVIRARPDVLSAERRVAAGRAFVSSARADYLPRISLSAGAGYIANEVDSFGGRGTFNYTFGPVITWHGLDMGRVKARVDEAQAQELEARARYQQILLIAQEELQGASVRYRTARVRLEHLRAAAAASERAASLATLRYEGGIADFLQVLDAERTLLAAQDQLAQGRTEAAEAFVALNKARGSSWPTQEAKLR